MRGRGERHPTPWRIIDTTLRPKPFDVRIIEIIDANGDTVFPWGGFDQMKGSHAAKLRLAKRVVKAVNGASPTLLGRDE